MRRRRALRVLRADDGISLVETVVALMVFAVIMSGLGATLLTLIHTTSLTKVRSAATALAQKLAEQDRALGQSNLVNCSAGGPTSPTTVHGTSYQVATGSQGGCIPWQTTNVPGSGFLFSVQTLVLIGQSSVDSDQNTHTEKILNIVVSWTVPGTGHYELNTAVDNTVPAGQVQQGIVVYTNDTATGNPIVNEAIQFNVTITGSTGNVVDSGLSADGRYTNQSLPVGSYTCTVDNNDPGASGYAPSTTQAAGLTVDAAAGSVSGPCNITANQLTSFTSAWTAQVACASSNVKGSLVITVSDTNGVPVNGANVSLTNVGSGATPPGAVNTNPSGVATFNNNVPADNYTYTVSAPGYSTASNLGPLCVAQGTTTNGTATLASSACSAGPGQATMVTISVVDAGTGAAINNATATLVNQSGGKSPPKAPPPPGGQPGQYIFKGGGAPQAGSYAYQVTAPGYAVSTSPAPVCVTAGGTYTYSVQMTTSGCASNKAVSGNVLVTVTDQLGNPISGAKVQLTNNGTDGGKAPGAGNTGSNGQWAANNVQNDPYFFTITPPNAPPGGGYQAPPLQSLCVAGTGTTSSTATVTSTMTLQVSVQNKDTPPSKTYTVVVTDPSSNTYSQSLTLPNTGPKSTGSVTFPGLVMGSGYVATLYSGVSQNLVTNTAPFSCTTPGVFNFSVGPLVDNGNGGGGGGGGGG